MKRMLNLNALLLTLIVSATPAIVASEPAKQGMFANAFSYAADKGSSVLNMMGRGLDLHWERTKADYARARYYTKTTVSNVQALVKEHPHTTGAIVAATALATGAAYMVYNWYKKNRKRNHSEQHATPNSADSRRF